MVEVWEGDVSGWVHRFGQFTDTASAGRHIRNNPEAVAGQQVRIVLVCKQFTVKTETQTKVVFE